MKTSNVEGEGGGFGGGGKQCPKMLKYIGRGCIEDVDWETVSGIALTGWGLFELNVLGSRFPALGVGFQPWESPTVKNSSIYVWFSPPLYMKSNQFLKQRKMSNAEGQSGELGGH